MSKQRRLDILIIDSEPETRRLIELVCRDSGTAASIKSVNDGLQALDHLARISCPPDLVFTDLDLPGVDGRRVLHIMRSLPNMAHTSVVVVTASISEAEAARSLDLRVNDLVRKPLDDSRLALIRKIVERQIFQGQPADFESFYTGSAARKQR